MTGCFIISPIGKEGSEIREHADDVWEFIIKPALDELGIGGYRADHVLEAGRITEQMYSALLSEDFCIAVLTYHNPNVFYEVAIAQSAGKPVIMLILKGATIPFDLHNIRVIEYDLKPRPISQKIYVKQLVQMIQRLQQGGWKLDVPFGVNLSPLGAAQAEVSVVVPAEKVFKTETWLDLIKGARSKFDIAAYGLSAWPAFPQIKETITEAADRGCRIRVLTYDATNPALQHLINYDKMASDLNAMGVRFETVRKFFRGILDGKPGCDVRAMKRGALLQQITFFDDELVLLPYLFSADSGQGPVIRCKSAFPLYATMRYEFDTLWSLNDPADV